ncbi:hypothetical protein [Haematomicrobium sanguinis]|uniref:hypothetical protein n=1 Tax=Haematomicrobium sanguinis TaxID=479106 RepID=UPI0012FA67D9|nr:hypothetical protein [Haematomicrobium sanguinis]
MAFGGLVVGVLLATFGEVSIPIAVTAFVVLSLVLVASARRHAFPLTLAPSRCCAGVSSVAAHR